MDTQQYLPLKPAEASPSTIQINGRCNYREEGEIRVIFANGIALLRYSRDDKAAEHYGMVLLFESGLASQQEIAGAFGYSRQTVFRVRRKYDQGGMSALVARKRGPKGGSKVTKALGRRILGLKNRELSHAAIASRLGLKHSTVRKALKRMGWSEPKQSEQQSLGLEVSEPEVGQAEVCESSAEADVSGCELEAEALEAEQMSCDSDASDRSMDRALARLGLLEDAAPLFQNAVDVGHVGVLLAIPALIESGILGVAKKVYGGFRASFYGLRTIFVTLLLMALTRIKCPERLKQYDAVEFGFVLGLDRSCEVKTLRRKLRSLAAQGKAVFFGQELAKMRLKRREGAIGFLYVDGHVRVYHGKRRVSKAYVTQRRLAMPATTDYWVNDENGEPVFVVSALANEGLVKMLEPILTEIRGLIGDDRRITVVFDRGGWSPKLFGKLIAEGFDIVTYLKGKTEPVQPEHFSFVREQIEGKPVEYWIHERSVAYLDGKLWLRRISRLSSTGHQTHVVTSRHDLPAVTVAYRMFERWRQENFFKYMREEYALDALVDYAVEEDDLERLVPNPKRKEINEERSKLKGQIKDLEGIYGVEALDDEDSKRRTMRGFRIANSALGRKIETLRQRQCELKALYKETPAKVPLRDTVDKDSPYYRLNPEEKHLTDAIKMVAYQAESDLLALIRPHYARADNEGRSLIKSVLMNSGDLEVTDHELHVRLNPLSSPHRTEIMQKLCEALNTTKTVYPGSKLRLVYEVKNHGHVA